MGEITSGSLVPIDLCSGSFTNIVCSLIFFLNFQKVKLLGYEEHFEEKCQEIDEKYKSQIEELKQTNIELR